MSGQKNSRSDVKNTRSNLQIRQSDDPIRQSGPPSGKIGKGATFTLASGYLLLAGGTKVASDSPVPFHTRNTLSNPPAMTILPSGVTAAAAMKSVPPA